jgi:hypothetical protein
MRVSSLASWLACGEGSEGRACPIGTDSCSACRTINILHRRDIDGETAVVAAKQRRE